MNKANEVQMPLTVNCEGREWSLYTFDFDTPDGVFSSYLYAISFEHAAALLADLKETAVLKGRMISVGEYNE